MSYKKYNQLGEKKEELKSYHIVEIQSLEHKQDLIRKHPILCIDVYAHWCRPCKQIEPTYAVLAKELSGKCMLVKENFENGFSKNFDITAVPTFLIFQNGIFQEKLQGADLNTVRSTLSKMLEGNNNNSLGMNVVDNSQYNNMSHHSSSSNYKQTGFNVGNRHRM